MLEPEEEKPFDIRSALDKFESSESSLGNEEAFVAVTMGYLNEIALLTDRVTALLGKRAEELGLGHLNK